MSPLNKKSWPRNFLGLLFSIILLSATSAQNLNCDPCIDRKSYKINAILHGDSSENFWKQVESAAEQSGKDMQVDFNIEFHHEEGGMVKAIESAIASKPDALIVSIPSATVQAAVSKALNSGIPVFGVNLGDQIAKSSGILDFVGMDQDEGGAEAAKELFKIRNSDIGKALFIDHKAGNMASEERKAGFKSELESKGAIVEVLDNTSSDSLAAALGGCAYDAILLSSDELLNDVLKAFKNCDQSVQPLATFGTSTKAIDAIAQGELGFTVSEQSFLQGALPVLMASVFATTGKKIVPPNTKTHIYKSGPRIVNLGNLPTNTLQTCKIDGFPICPNTKALDGISESTCDCTERSEIRIGGVLHGVTQDVFWDPVFAASTQAARDMGIELLLDRFEPVEDQILLHKKMAAKMESLCKQDIDGLFVTIPSREVVDALKTCKSLNIPIISINTGIEVSQELGLVHHVGMLEYDAGVGAGKRLIENGMKKGLCLDHEPGNTALIDRCNGFEEAIRRANNAGASIQYLGTRNVTLDNAAQYKSIVENAVDEDGDWSGIGLFILGPVQVEEALLVQESHKEVIIGAVDTSDAMYDAIDEGKILFGIQQGPYMQGYMPIPLLTWLAYTGQTLTNKVIQSGPSFVETSPSEALQTCEKNMFGVCATEKEPTVFSPAPASEGGPSSDKTALIASLVVVFGVLFIAVAFLAFRMKKLDDHIAQLEQQGTRVPNLSFSQKMASAVKPVDEVVESARLA